MLKKLLLGCIAAASLAPAIADDAAIPYWQDMRVTSVNRMEPRTEFSSWTNEKDALSKAFEESPYYKSLNGKWKFFFTADHRTLPAGITDAGVDTQGWSDINVPGNWEPQGFGTAIYTNIPYDFAPSNPQPPALPEAVETGVYHRTFTLPDGWSAEKDDIYLNIAGAKSGVYVYVNGNEVGYNEDSKDMAEFLINPYLKPGVNELALKIYRYSTGSYLEDQDFWRLSGIERDVYLSAQPKAPHLWDFKVVSTLNDAYDTGLFSLQCDIANSAKDNAGAVLGYTLLSPQGRKVASASADISAVPMGTKGCVYDFPVAEIPNVEAWSSEHPNLYTLLISCNGVVTPYKVAFRRIELSHSDRLDANGRPYPIQLINGQPIKIKGVNIHEHDPYTGHYVTEDLMRHDFELMRQNNINAVRLCHYPQQRRFYELAAEYGLYVYDEANIESHGMGYDLSKGKTLGNNPDWLPKHMERTRNMYERNKNQPAVMWWSLGNEAGNGYNFYQTYLWLKDQERNGMNRPVNYERAIWEWNTDIFVPQYPEAADFETWGREGTDRPVMPSEYAHAMGNSTGNFWGQWQAIYEYPNLAGGFIWDWVDQGLIAYDDSGRPYWAYGGDFGVNAPSDGNFNCNGLVSPDRNPHPGMTEVKYVHQPVSIVPVEPAQGRYIITNRFYFTPLTDYRIDYSVVDSKGKTLARGSLNEDLAPQQSREFTIPMPAIPDNMEAFVNFSVIALKDDTGFKAGHAVANEQAVVNAGAKLPYVPITGPGLQIVKDGPLVKVSNKNVEFSVDKASGVVTSYKAKGKQYIDKEFGLQPNFWRAPNDNDYGNGEPARTQVWKQASHNFNVKSIDAVEDGGDAVVTIVYALPAGDDYTVAYRVRPDASVKVDATLSPAPEGTPEVPRVGLRMRMPASMNHVEYLGHGPEENYIDRFHGTPVGLYKALADDMGYPYYVRPQETGHRTGVRYLSLTDRKGHGLSIVADSLIEFNALRNSVEDFDGEDATYRPYQWTNRSEQEIAERDDDQAKNVLRRQTHYSDIQPQDFVEVCIDMRQMGVGGYTSWGAWPERIHRIYADQPIHFGFTIIPQ